MNYLKIAFRNLKKQKVYSFLNIFGLACGMAFCLIIFLFVQDEVTYDSFHENADRIYRVNYIRNNPDGSIRSSGSTHPVPLAAALKEEVAGIEEGIRVKQRTHFVKSINEAIEEQVHFVDPTFLTTFTFPLSSNYTEFVLRDLDSVVLSQRAAKKYFSDRNPLGQKLYIRLEKTFEEFVVKGIAQNVPGNSTIKFDFLLPIDRLITSISTYQRNKDNWTFVSIPTYVLLNSDVDMMDMNRRLSEFHEKHYPSDVDELKAKENFPEDIVLETYSLESIRNLHLNHYSKPIYSYILAGIALAVLLIACINFITFSIGRSSGRSMEIGMRKVVGAKKSQLLYQLWGESVLLVLFALGLGLVLAKIFLPVFNQLTGKVLLFNFTQNWTGIVMLVGLLSISGLISGGYPALFLSDLSSIETLKGKMTFKGSNKFTKILVIAQFSISIIFIISTLVMTKQLSYTQTKNPGFSKDQIVVIKTNGLDGQLLANRFRTMIGNHLNIIDITAVSNIPGSSGSDGYRFPYNEKTYTINVFNVEPNYLDFMEIQLLEGRDFDPKITTDAKNSIIVNEALVKEFNILNPIGKIIPGFSGSSEKGPFIIGVVSDYNYQTLYQTIIPMMLIMDKDWGYPFLNVHITHVNIQDTINLLKQTWEKVAVDVPFSFKFLDDRMQAAYQSDQNWERIIKYASIFAILIACSGLFGLMTLAIANRKKEIAIRKVLGASVPRITILLFREFALFVLISFVLAAPVAYLIMYKWLGSFAFRITLSLDTFILGGAITFLIAVLTISSQTIKACLENPVKNLHIE